ncbi:MAG: sugar ABC transporter ATP-binding protein, partial [Bdellovibrio sp.]|nr:sugar ABC transporter ATP-binding protein [Bdellovibrio sp.]
MSKAIHAPTLEPILAFHQVSKTFPGMRALDKISFQVREGEVVSLVGENGAGKSTLMKVLSGVWPRGTYDGEVRLRGVPAFFNNTKEAMAAGIAMIHQELSLFPELTIGEHLELDQLPYWINWKQLFQRTQEFLDKLGFGLSSKSRVCDLSIGGKQLVEVARALYRKAKILVFDEPTSALTENEVIKLYEIIQKLRQENRAIIYITHKMNEVFHLADRIIVLRDGQKVGEIQRLQNGKLLSRSEIEPRLITLMVGRPIQDIYPLKNQNFGSELLRVENLSLQTNHGEKLVDNFS